MYESTFNAPVGSLRVLHDEEAFDWQRGRFLPEGDARAGGHD